MQQEFILCFGMQEREKWKYRGGTKNEKRKEQSSYEIDTTGI